MTSEILWSDPKRDLTITVSNRFEKEELDLVHQTAWGTNGPLFIYQDRIDSEINRLREYQVLSMRKKNELVGTYMISRKTIYCGTQSYSAAFHTLFSVAPKFQKQKLGQQLVTSCTRYALEGNAQPLFAYGRVEEANANSLKLVKSLGYQSFARLSVVLCSRLFTKKRCQLVTPDENERDDIQKQLFALYQDHILADFDQSLDCKHFRYVQESGRMRVGLQFKQEAWRMLYMPGLDGKIMMVAMPHIPILRRMFNPKNYRFLWLYNLYVPEGTEKEFFDLMETVLFETGNHSALMMLDPRSNVYQRLQAQKKFGLLYSLSPEAGVHVMCATKGLNPETVQALKNGPMVDSGYDI